MHPDSAAREFALFGLGEFTVNNKVGPRVSADLALAPFLLDLLAPRAPAAAAGAAVAGAAAAAAVVRAAGPPTDQFLASRALSQLLPNDPTIATWLTADVVAHLVPLISAEPVTINMPGEHFAVPAKQVQ